MRGKHFLTLRHICWHERACFKVGVIKIIRVTKKESDQVALFTNKADEVKNIDHAVNHYYLSTNQGILYRDQDDQHL